jgi:hypothetical protein
MRWRHRGALCAYFYYQKLSPVSRAYKKELAHVLDELWHWYDRASCYGRDPTAQNRKWLEDEFDRIMNQHVDNPDLVNRFMLTRAKRPKLLFFLNHPGLPIQNNPAEQGERSVAVMRNMSGGTKSEEGDRSFERHMSVIGTIYKQELNVFDTLFGLLYEGLDPFVLTKKQQPPLMKYAH